MLSVKRAFFLYSFDQGFVGNMQKQFRCTWLQSIALFSVSALALPSCTAETRGRDDGAGEENSGIAEASETDSNKSGHALPSGDQGSSNSSPKDSSHSGMVSSSADTKTNTSPASSQDESVSTNATTTASNSATTSSTNSLTSSRTSSMSSPSSSDECPKEAINFDTITPTVYMLVDKSGSMKYALDKNTSRWNAMLDVLTTGSDAIIPRMQSEVRFGLSTYGSKGSVGNGDLVCPDLAHVDPKLSNFTAIKSQLERTVVNGGTPTGEALTAMQARMQADTFKGPKVMVLVTDGEPYSCSDLSSNTDEEGTEAAVKALHLAGFETYVISVGLATKDSHLQAVANYGKGLADPTSGGPKAKFYKSADRNALVKAFEEIINGTRSCKLGLKGKILAGYEKEGRVTINGVAKKYNDPNGWRVNNPQEIELLGTACSEIRQGNVEVKVEFDCNAIVPG